MTRKHVLLYDIALPLAFILGCGFVLSEFFAEPLIYRLDALARAHAWGAYWGQTGVQAAAPGWRAFIWENSETLFALPIALLWLGWFSLNRQRNLLTGEVTLDRPFFQMVRNVLVWIEGGGETAQMRRHYEGVVARQEDKIRQLQSEMHRVDRFQRDIETHFGE